MSWGIIAVTAVSTGVQLYSSYKNRKAAEKQAEDSEKRQIAESKKLEKQKAEYKAMQFKNPYENLENVYEDLTVNQQQAQFEAQQGAQQRANIMQGLRGAAGGSGIAALAQQMANQGQLQAQRISASIGQQEAQNQRLRAQGAMQVQQLERSGEQQVQQMEMNRQANLLGMQAGVSTRADQSFYNAQANETQVRAQTASQDAAAIGSLATAGINAGFSARTSNPAPTGTTIQTNSLGQEVSVMPGYDADGNPLVNLGDGTQSYYPE